MLNATATPKAGRPRAARILRIIARSVGIIVVLFFLIMLIGDVEMAIKNQGFGGITSEWLFIIVPLVIALAAFIIAWRRELLGGILLLIAYLLLSFSPSLHSLFYKAEPQFYWGMFYFAAPFMVSGVLFIIAARMEKSRPA